VSAVIERTPTEADETEAPSDGLFQVWIDLNEGETPSDWWWNSEPQPLRDALQEAAEVRAAGWVVAVYPEGQNPRPDGRWDNP
jgi:hypothetical protein